MKPLFWKEWYEQRWLPLSAAAWTAAICLLMAQFNHWGGNTQPLQVGDLFSGLAFSLFFVSVIAGGPVFSQEIGNDTLSFLGMLPVTRTRIWRVKVCAALGMFLLSVFLSLLACLLLAHILLPTVNIGPAEFSRLSLTRTFLLRGSLIYLDIFAVSLAVSTFLDRTLSATVTAALLSLAIWYSCAVAISNLSWHLISHTNGYYLWHQEMINREIHHLVDLLAVLPLPIMLAISYWTFTRGESLRTAKRFKIGAIVGAAGLAAASALVGAGFHFNWW